MERTHRTFELVQMAVPTREEKKRLARLVGLSESLIYKWCEDPDGSGRSNPLDGTEAILEHARLFHPDAALAITQHFEAGNRAAIGRRSAGVPLLALVTDLQPATERELHEALCAFTAALRQLLASGKCDMRVLAREVEDAERQLSMVGVMVRAAIEAEERQTAANG